MLKLSFLNLFRRKIRTFLALLGIAIGVAAIMTMVSVVDGVYAEIDAAIAQFQGIYVMQKDTLDESMSYIDERYGSKLESVPNVAVAVPEIWYMPKKVDGKPAGLAAMGGLSTPPYIYAPDIQKHNQMRGTGWFSNVEKGQMLKANESGYVLIGKKIEDEYNKFVGSTIELDDKKFKVKGILEIESEMYERFIVMNLNDARELSSFPAGKVSTFTVSLIDPAKDKKTAEFINFKFGEDVDAIVISDYSEQFGSILGNFRLVVFFVAAISAIVAGVGIINTVLMSVLERSKEIGTLRATGWTENNIMRMIIYESTFLGILGGIVGIILGYFAAQTLDKGFGLPTLVSMPLVIEVFLFALFLGLFAGIYPAIRASKMDPIEAIRAG